MKITLILGWLLLFASASHAGEKVRVAFASQDFGNWHFCGSRENHKPYCQPGDQVFGFNADIARELFKRLNLEYEIVFRLWDGDDFLKGLQSNLYDVIISNVGFKESRKEYGLYSSLPYEPVNGVPDYFFFTLNAEQFTLKKIGVVKDTLLHAFLKTLYKEEAINTYQGPEELIQSLLSGESDSIFASFSGNKEWICARPEIVKLTTIPTSLNVNGIDDDTYILTAKRLPDLSKKIDAALKAMHDDETIKNLFDKWISEKPVCD